MLKRSDWTARSRLAAAALSVWAGLCWLTIKVLNLVCWLLMALVGLRLSQTLSGWSEYRDYCSSEASAILIGAGLIAFTIWRKKVTFQVGQIVGLTVGDNARVSTTREPWRKS